MSTLLFVHPETHDNEDDEEQQQGDTSPMSPPSSSPPRPPAINAAMAGWGALLRRAYGRADALRAGMRAGDVTAEYLTYYTDNGAYYYYRTEEDGDPTGGGNKVRWGRCVGGWVFM